ncbi:ABC-2 type transport system permease protein [Pseudidiomarina planktonica]|uniref:ABC-2 type transport system permease protein n=1 Tax=Pseudidiomarina planktonica TaxID=1323738 RepID=A0A1Y6EUW9_9GAMM|nr:ABC transporter permease [Pseudidiomarina planktonica]RUO65429.1 ABC transporter permease [Pseudidiomarina planktonica]SMQ65041.1 ABC-2 type transport system permease protein [Pseudidiomarina planktonica]
MFAIHQAEAKYDLLSLWRTPGFYLPAILFPVVFYYFFGVVFSFSSGAAPQMLVAYSCFGVIGPALFNFSVAVASDRVHGWMALKRLSPMPLSAYMLAKYVSSTVFAVVILALLFTLSAVVADVNLWTWQWASLALILLAGTLPFALLGLLLGLVCSDKSVPGVVNLIYLPMAFLSGLWVPFTILPDYVQRIAEFLPTYHLSQLAFKIIDADQGQPVWLHLGYLVAFSLVLGLLIRWRFSLLQK